MVAEVVRKKYTINTVCAINMIDIGIIGAGGMAENIHIPILKSIDDVRVGFVADIEKQKSERLGNMYSISSVVIDDISSLPRSDVLVLAIPVGVRQKYVEEAAHRETPIFCDKPFAADLETHDEFLNQATYIACNYQRQFYNNIRQMSDILTSGLFGPVRSAYFHEIHPGSTGINKDSYRMDKGLSGGGILIEKGCHSLSQIDAMFPESEITVSDVDIDFVEGFDTKVQATLRIDSSLHSFDLEFKLGKNRHDSTEAGFVFDDVKATFDPTNPSDPVTIEPADSSDGTTFDIKPANEHPIEYIPAMYRSWEVFLSELDCAVRSDLEVATSRTTTRLIDKMYSDAQVDA